MNREEYVNWIKSLKASDPVRVVTYPGCFSTTNTVKTVTKTGKIRLDNGELFNNEGDRNTKDSFKRLFPVDSKCV